MVTEQPDGDREEEVADLVESSRLLELVAREGGATVRRLYDDLVWCEFEGRQFAFRGLAGAGCGRVAQLLCRNDLRLRSLLESSGVPTVAAPSTDELAHRGPGGQLCRIAVVAGRVVASDLPSPPGPAPSDREQRVGALALRAVAAVPGTEYGSVAIIEDAGVHAVASVDPVLCWWVSGHEQGRAVAQAILDFEFGSVRAPRSRG